MCFSELASAVDLCFHKYIIGEAVFQLLGDCSGHANKGGCDVPHSLGGPWSPLSPVSPYGVCGAKAL